MQGRGRNPPPFLFSRCTGSGRAYSCIVDTLIDLSEGAVPSRAKRLLSEAKHNHIVARFCCWRIKAVWCADGFWRGVHWHVVDPRLSHNDDAGCVMQQSEVFSRLQGQIGCAREIVVRLSERAAYRVCRSPEASGEMALAATEHGDWRMGTLVWHASSFSLRGDQWVDRFSNPVSRDAVRKTISDYLRSVDTCLRQIS